MNMDHFAANFFAPERGVALLTRNRPKSAVVFVHGFKGDPTLTWVDFYHLIERRPEWGDVDLFFYGYESKDQILPLAQDFGRFLLTIAGRAEESLIPDLTLPSRPKSRWGEPTELLSERGGELYGSITLVGHSTGAVIIRQAVLLNYHAMKTVSSSQLASAHRLIEAASLRLFAPAHLGVLSAGRLGLARSIPGVSWFVESFLRCNPLYQNLQPGSPILVDLRRETEDVYKAERIPACKALSIFGQHEEIVFTGKYAHDEQPQIVPDKNHVSVCKPNFEYQIPLGFVVDARPIAKVAG